MSRKVLLVLLLWSAIVPARASGERKGGPGFVDDFRTLDNLRADATENVSQLRDFPRIVTRPDVRVNPRDPGRFKDSRTGRSVAYGFAPDLVRLKNGDLLTEGLEKSHTRGHARDQ